MNSGKPDSGQVELPISIDEYRDFQVFLSQTCGIELGETKLYLVKNRLAGILKDFDFNSFRELLHALYSTSNLNMRLKTCVIDAMTTNETFWFRDQGHFSELKNLVLPRLFKQKTTAIRCWSAACSSGQEPYTISMCVESMSGNSLESAGKHMQIIGTDISDAILHQARNGVFSELALSRGLDPTTKARFFQQTHEGYLVKQEISRRVKFQRFNLLKPFAALGKFDIIFCRNVLIYFSDETKKDILKRMAIVLEPGGYLFLSSTESMPTEIEGLILVKGRPTRYFQKVK